MGKQDDEFEYHIEFKYSRRAVILIAAFIALFALFLYAESSRAGTVAGGVGITSLEYSGGELVVYTEEVGKKFAVGLGWMNEQDCNCDEAVTEIQQNAFVLVERVVSWKRVDLSLGLAAFQNQTQVLPATVNFSLSAGVRVTDRIGLQWRHFSNGGTKSSNRGQDALLVTWRF